MEVTDIRLGLATREGGTKAFGSFSLDGAFAIRGIRVMEDKNGKNFVAFPSREKSNGEYEDIAFPLSKELYHKIEDAVVAEYQKVLAEKQNESEKQSQSETEAAEQEQKATQETAPKKGKSR